MSALKHGARVTAVDALHAMGDPLWHFSGGAMFRYLVSTSSAKETTISWSQWEYLCDILDSGPPKDGWLANIPADDGREGGTKFMCNIRIRQHRQGIKPDDSDKELQACAGLWIEVNMPSKDAQNKQQRVFITVAQLKAMCERPEWTSKVPTLKSSLAQLRPCASAPKEASDPLFTPLLSRIHAQQPAAAVAMRAELQYLVLSALVRQPDNTMLLTLAKPPASLKSAVGSPGLVAALLSAGLGGNKANPNQVWGDSGSMSVAMAVALESDWATLGALYRGGADFSTLRGGPNTETVQELVERATQQTLFEVGVPDEEELFCACENNDADIIRQLMQLGTKPDCRQSGPDGGATPLMTAAYFGCTQGVRALLEHSCDINARHRGRTAVMMAAAGGCLDTLRVLCEHKGVVPGLRADLFARESGDGCTALFLAAQEGHLDCLRTLMRAAGERVAAGLDASTTADLQRLTDMRAQNSALRNFMRRLRLAPPPAIDLPMMDEERGPTQLMNFPNARGTTPLLVAVANGHTECVAYMLEAGADVNVCDSESLSALTAAAHLGHTQMAVMLLQGGADTHGSGKDWKTRVTEGVRKEGPEPVLYAAANGDVKILKELHKHGCDVEKARDQGGHSALMITALNGDIDALKCLVDAKADPGSKNKAGLNTEAILKKQHGMTFGEAVAAAALRQAIATSAAANDFADEEAKAHARGKKVIARAFDDIMGLDAERVGGGARQTGDGRLNPADMTILEEGLHYADSYTASKCLVDDGDGDGQRWLTPDGKPSWFIVDLGTEYTILGYDIKNTFNGFLEDRWTQRFKIETSLHRLQGWTVSLEDSLDVGIELQNFDDEAVDAVVARYVRFTVVEFGGGGGGLSMFLPTTKRQPKTYSKSKRRSKGPGGDSVTLADAVDVLERVEVDREVSDPLQNIVFAHYFMQLMLTRGGSFGKKTSDKERLVSIRVTLKETLAAFHDYREASKAERGKFPSDIGKWQRRHLFRWLEAAFAAYDSDMTEAFESAGITTGRRLVEITLPELLTRLGLDPKLEADQARVKQLTFLRNMVMSMSAREIAKVEVTT